MTLISSHFRLDNTVVVSVDLLCTFYPNLVQQNASSIADTDILKLWDIIWVQFSAVKEADIEKQV